MAHVRIVASTALAATVWGWASFGSAIATIAGIAWGAVGDRRKRRRRAKAQPKRPRLPATPEAWAEYDLRMDQWEKDNSEGDTP